MGNLRKLFTPFERLGAAKSGVEGTGLGLVLSQRLVAAMGGTLEVENIVGQGCTFFIELPGEVPHARGQDVAKTMGMSLAQMEAKEKTARARARAKPSKKR